MTHVDAHCVGESVDGAVGGAACRLIDFVGGVAFAAVSPDGPIAEGKGQREHGRHDGDEADDVPGTHDAEPLLRPRRVTHQHVPQHGQGGTPVRTSRRPTQPSSTP